MVKIELKDGEEVTFKGDSFILFETEDSYVVTDKENVVAMFVKTEVVNAVNE